MTWNFTLLFVHLFALTWSVRLYKYAPCWMQKFVMAGLAFAMLICSVGHALAIFGWWGSWHVLVGGWALSNIASILYLFRLRTQAWPKPSTSSLSSPI